MSLEITTNFQSRMGDWLICWEPNIDMLGTEKYRIFIRKNIEKYTKNIEKYIEKY